jgi:PAS domain S-box-containing protein
MSSTNGKTRVNSNLNPESKRSTQEIRRRATELELIADVSTAATQVLDATILLQTVVELAKEKFALYHAHAYLVNDAGNALLLAAGAGEIGSKMVDEGHHIAVNAQRSLVARAARTLQGVTINDVTTEPGFLPNKYLPNTRAEIALPMIVGDELLGVLDFQADEVGRFDEEDIRIKTILAQQVAVALRNARTYEQIRYERARAERTAKELEVAAEVSSAIATILNLDELLKSVTELTKARFDLYHAHIYLLDEDGQQLILAAGAGEPGRVMKERGHRISVAHPSSIVARTAREQKTTFVNDVTASPTFLPNPLLPNTRSEIAAPMIASGRLIGVLDMQSDVADSFTEVDLTTKASLANQIAVAVVNANTFKQIVHTQTELIQSIEERAAIEEQIRRRASELETVATVSTAVSTLLDQEVLLQTVVDLTKANFELYHAHVYLLDDNREYLLLAAGAGEAGARMIARGHRIAAAHPNSLVARAARTGSGVVSNDVSQQSDFLPNPLLPNTRSEMALPMIAGEQVIGVLDVQSDQVNRFTDDDVLVQTTLAAQIAVAIQNVRAIERIKLTERAIENSTSGMTIADARLPDMPLVYINRAFELITGYSVDEAIGKNCRFLQADDNDQPGLLELRAALREQRQTTVILRNYRKDGTLFWNELRLSPIFNQRGELTHFVGVQTDITERQQIELEREAMLRQTEEQAHKDRETAQRLLELDRLKSQFLANMSHELRTPLNSIIGYSELLLDGDDGELTEEAHEDIETIHTSGQHLLSIINEILDLAKIEAGQMSIDARAVQLESIAAEVLQAAEVLVKSKSVELKLTEESPVTMVSADPLRLRQILNNLVSNAIKFTERGSVEIAYGCDSPGVTYVEVRDTGMGMSGEDLTVIFQQFRQVDGSSTRRAGGTGLGLAITKALVELHGGTISVNSVVNQGTTFRLTLPIAVNVAEPAT